MGFASWPLGNEGSWLITIPITGETPTASLGAVAQAGFGGFLAELFDLRKWNNGRFWSGRFLTILSEMLSKVVSNQKQESQ